MKEFQRFSINLNKIIEQCDIKLHIVRQLFPFNWSWIWWFRCEFKIRSYSNKHTIVYISSKCIIINSHWFGIQNQSVKINRHFHWRPILFEQNIQVSNNANGNLFTEPRIRKLSFNWKQNRSTFLFFYNTKAKKNMKRKITYRSKMRASFKTLPKLMYASKKFGSNVTAFSKWCIANHISPCALNTHPKLLHATAKSGRVSIAFK